MSNLIANRYEVIRHIGQGGMADVFVAVDTILNREVAVKMMRGELSKDTVSVLRFEREAQAATTLSHPNIVEIYDVGEYKGHHYIVMEYVPGKTLKAMIRDRGALYKEEAVDIMKQLVSATAEAHRRGIIHRDIKPQNVIVKADGTVKVLDFGIAMLTQGNMQLTQSNSVMGSVHYLAPELARGESASAQSDIYALGIVLYEMLTGEVPFKADSAVQVALMHMRNEMPSVRDFNPAIPQSLENIVIRATAKNKGLRYRSCNEMLEDLRTCLRPERADEPRLILPSVSEQAAQTHSASPKSVIRKSVRRAETAGERSQTSVHAAVEAPAPKKNRTMLHFLIVLLVALAAAGIYFALSLTGVFKPASKQVAVPDLVGLTVTDAKDVCTDNHLVLDTSNVQYTLTEDVEKGKIISSDPAAGSEIDRGSRVSVTVSSGIGATVSDYTGRTSMTPSMIWRSIKT
jgi:serine/threonine protein kinase